MRPATPIIQLPSGSSVGFDLAVGLSAMVAAGWAVRRQHRRHRQPTGPPADPLQTALIRHLASLPYKSRDDDDRDGSVVPALEPSPPADEPSSGERPTGQEPATGVPTSRPATTISFGDRNGQIIPLTLDGHPAISLHGPAAPGVLRAVLCSLLTQHPAEDLELLVAGADLSAELLGPVVPPHLTVLPATEELIDRLETEVVSRTRLLLDTHQNSVADYRIAHLDEPVPHLVAVTASIPEGCLQRVRALLETASPNGLTFLALDDLPNGLAVTVDENAIVVHTDPATDDVVGARLTSLNAGEATELLAAVATAYTTPGGSVVEAAPPVPPAPAIASTVPVPVALMESFDDSDQGAPVRVQLFGQVRLSGCGQPVSNVREAAKELLAFLLLHPPGATRDAILDALWPEVDLERSRLRLRTAVTNLRTCIRASINDAQASVLQFDDGTYRLQPHLFAADVIEFQAAIAAAERAADDDDACQHWERALNLYTAELCLETYYGWVEACRQQARAHAVNAALSLAQHAERRGDLGATLDHLSRAVALDPLMEESHRLLMRIHAKRRDAEAIRRVYRSLGTVLANHGLEPTPATSKYVGHLLHRVNSVAEPVTSTTFLTNTMP